MEWYVYYDNCNINKIQKYNVFDHVLFRNEVIQLLKENIEIEEFSKKLNNVALYYFWSKCEWEIVLKSWVGNSNEVKVDVYDQLMINWDKFVNYVWSCKEVLHD